MEVYFLFNKTTHEFIGFTLDPRTLSGDILYIRKTIDPEESLLGISWEGDYKTGKMIRISEAAAIVTEYDLIDKLYDRFFRKYSIEDVIKNILLIYLDENIESFPKESKDMISFFKKVYDKHIEEIKFFKESKDHNYKSTNSLEKTAFKQFTN